MSGTGPPLPRRSQDRQPTPAHQRSTSGQLPAIPVASPVSSRRPSLDAATAVRHKGSSSHLLAPAARGDLQLEARNGGREAGLTRWEAAVGNLEDARVGFDILARAVEDAVYLDEDAFNKIVPTAQFTKVLQAQQRRISQLELQLRETRARLDESDSIQTEALQRHAEMQQELENNAVVFKMHYQELLAKDEEIQKLTAVIQALSGR